MAFGHKLPRRDLRSHGHDRRRLRGVWVECYAQTVLRWKEEMAESFFFVYGGLCDFLHQI